MIMRVLPAKRRSPARPCHVARLALATGLLGVLPVLIAALPPGSPRESGRESQPLVLSAVVEAIIHPVSAEYMVETIGRADAERASLVVFTLRTPGGLVDATRTIVSKMIAARTPVAVWIGPAGARAASAGFLLTIAADVA